MIVVAALVAAVAGGAIYQLFLHAVPLIFLDLVACCAVASFLGAIAQYCVRRRALARGAAMALAAALTLTLLASSHAVAYALGVREIAARTGMPPSLVRERVGVREWIDLRMRGGFALSRGATLRGPGVAALWGAEALLMLAVVGYAVDKQTRR